MKVEHLKVLASVHRSEMGFDVIFGLGGGVQRYLWTWWRGTTSATAAQVQVDRINGFMGIRMVGGRQVGNHYILH